MTDIAQGDRVVTTDGHVIGKVKAVATDCFKVDVPFWPDQWLSKDSVRNVTVGEVHLNINDKETINEAKEGEGHLGFHVHDDD